MLNDCARCKALLELRRRGFSNWATIKHSFPRYTPIFLVLAVGVWLLTQDAPYREAGIILVGLTVGAILRDLRWIYTIRKGWPLTVRITDWEIVQGIADGKDVTG